MATLGLILILAYAVVSISSALRMMNVHGHYVHIEYAEQWARRGAWAPRRIVLLRRMRWVALLGVVLLLPGPFLSS